MNDKNLTKVQKNLIQHISDGAEIYEYKNPLGKLCYKSDEDGLRAILYLTLTVRSLIKRNILIVNHNKMVVSLNLLQRNLIRKREEYNKIGKELKELISYTKTHCTHPSNMLKQHSVYDGGGYDFTDSTTSWKECLICGHTSKKVYKSHGSYS